MRASGTHQRKLGHGSGAVFSPDARKVAFYRLGDILVMRANGTDVHEVTQSLVSDQSPTWGVRP